MKISIVTGTLNRLKLLPKFLANTVYAHNDIELVLVDGGSCDGTQEFIHNQHHDRIKLLEVGHRSPYWDYMNRGIKEASHDMIVIWNDDVLMKTQWTEVFRTIEGPGDVFLFSWWNERPKEWSLYFYPPGEAVINYGAVKRHVFEKIGMYHPAYRYYCADGEMGMRAWAAGFSVVPCKNIKVMPVGADKRAIYYPKEDQALYDRHLNLLRNKQLPTDVEFLQPRQK